MLFSLLKISLKNQNVAFVRRGFLFLLKFIRDMYKSNVYRKMGFITITDSNNVILIIGKK